MASISNLNDERNEPLITFMRSSMNVTDKSEMEALYSVVVNANASDCCFNCGW